MRVGAAVRMVVLAVGLGKMETGQGCNSAELNYAWWSSSPSAVMNEPSLSSSFIRFMYIIELRWQQVGM